MQAFPISKLNCSDDEAITKQAASQAELKSFLEEQHKGVRSEIFKTVEISFYDHEIHVDDKLIANITHDHSDFVTQRWVVVINDVEIHRANTWMKCYDYIIWHYKKGTLPKQQQEVEPVNTDNEQMAQIATECKKFGFDLHDSGIYYNSVKLGEVGCTDGKWWVVRASSQHQLQVPCNSISDAVWSLWMVEVSPIEATQITSTPDTNNGNCEELLDKPFDELISEEWERLRKYKPLHKSKALFSVLKQ
ncbi:hypothetical protein IQ247_10715 [Plectonema cf. radiosum LEGE 06105]|uniref:Uncharacterized protein n=1 Tax=Plectonema cf. radiosum LEGE 06105 TaxID=945769 RepID=A0A8J7F370_9CYAN|nr:hypothetical protein [Plectonema cf. radiosum LEGE 06105]